jgi:para-nitrobenzyl esterase
MRKHQVIICIAAIAAAATLQAASDQVKIQSGRVKGVVKDGVISFKGIPFAAPPVGDLRWRPPQPVKPWSGVRPAVEYGSDCMQKPFPGDAAPLGTPPAEDCLFMNVWVPEKPASRKLPVMVWIYGGGFVNGGSSPAVYDGSQFARRGVVFVSFNYRLGRFGFFAHPALTKENPSGPLGNYGYMDQIAALQWVQKNAAAFGGDPENVTVFGESAGGGSVLTMLTSPLAKGLVHKAIVESGGGRTLLLGPRYLSRSDPKGLPSGESVGVAFAKSVGIEGDDAAALAALRKLPAGQVVAGLNMASMNVPTYAGPMIDGKVVVESPAEAYAAGRGAKVPLMAGANSADIGFAFAKTIDELFAPFGPDAPKAKAAYDPQGNLPLQRVAMTFAADRMMVEPARFIVRTLAAAGQPAYEFRFSYVAESMRKQWPGAPHATEIPFVFDTVAARYGKDLTEADKATASAANQYWVNFARTGNPNGQGLPEWPVYTPQADKLMDFALSGPAAKPDPWKVRLDLVEKLANQ